MAFDRRKNIASALNGELRCEAAGSGARRRATPGIYSVHVKFSDFGMQER
jgi:hypothetical protein